jgi:hypothetical protein
MLFCFASLQSIIFPNQSRVGTWFQSKLYMIPWLLVLTSVMLWTFSICSYGRQFHLFRDIVMVQTDVSLLN